MKALAYNEAHSLEKFSIKEVEVADPKLLPHDILVGVKAISVNPVDYKIRGSRSGENVIIGWDAAGVILALGSEVKNFKVGDEVYYAGDLTRSGSYAEKQAVDSRIVALKPKSLSLAQAAALPLTTLTAWEALLSRGFDLDQNSKVMIIGGAGGVGSIAIQLLKAKTKSQVIATASRPETIEWVKSLGADVVIDHRQDLKAELQKKDIKEVDVIFGTTHSDNYLKVIPELIRPFGHLVLIDDPSSLDIVSFKRKALSVHWEFMFSKTLHNYQIETQGQILSEVAALVDSGKIKTTMNTHLKGFTAANIKQAHESAEKGLSVGKIVIEF